MTKKKKSIFKILLQLLFLGICMLVLNFQDDYRAYRSFKSKYSMKSLTANCDATNGLYYIDCFRENYIASINKADMDAIIYIYPEATKVIIHDKKILSNEDKASAAIESTIYLCDATDLAFKALDSSQNNRSFVQKVINLPLEWLRIFTIDGFKSQASTRLNTLIDSILTNEISSEPRFDQQIQKLKQCSTGLR